MIYFDHAATSPLNSEVLSSYEHLLETSFANSESSYDKGVLVRQQLEKSRKLTASMLNVKPEDIIFTSGASESNNLALKGLAFAHQHKGRHIITTNVEHSSVLESCLQLRDIFNFEVTFLSVNEQGSITLQQVQQAIRPDTILVSVMAINNEVGSINPIHEIGQFLKEKSILFHVDGVQALTKMNFDFNVIDAASFSAHKLGGLKGSGILVKKVHIPLVPLINGGVQEFGLRGGTSDALTHTLFYKTLKLAQQNQGYEKVKSINDYIRHELLQFEDCTIHSPLEASPYILSFSLKKLTSEMMANSLNQQEIYVSYRSTCHNRDRKGSIVLKAMGVSEVERQSVIRLSFSSSNTLEEAQTFIETLKGIHQKYAPR